MQNGITTWDGRLDPPDNRQQGAMEAGLVSGMSPSHPLVGGPVVNGLGAFDVDRSGSRIATLPDVGGAAGGAMAGSAGVTVLDDWRDLLNFKGSPMPWLLMLSLLALGLMQFRLNARVGPGRADVALG